MDEDAAADPYADRLGASYSIYGDLDVDALLAIARPWAPFRVWRKGDPAGGSRLATTAGVTIDIGEDRNSLEPAILRFLMEERAFLTAASRLVSHRRPLGADLPHVGLRGGTEPGGFLADGSDAARRRARRTRGDRLPLCRPSRSLSQSVA